MWTIILNLQKFADCSFKRKLFLLEHHIPTITIENLFVYTYIIAPPPWLNVPANEGGQEGFHTSSSMDVRKLDWPPEDTGNTSYDTSILTRYILLYCCS